MQGTPHRLFIEWAAVVDDVRCRRRPSRFGEPERSPAAGASFARQLYAGHRHSPFVARFATRP